ncbi:MAG: dihydroorotate dehydrogenase electron transfer subunit [Nitrososphaerota archaeon]|nr:dihydroorotate dehydrogenase electron transfer subunit [Nitrososphaerota archaeon]
MVKNVRETRDISTVFFVDPECSTARPGQFVMVWEPGFDEFPMSLSNYDAKGVSSVTVKPWGPGSGALVGARRGEVIGIRGPYGRPFTVEKCGALLVGGGTGLAPLLPLAKALVKAGAHVTVVLGGRSKSDILFEKQFRRVVKRKNLFITTDDGSHGRPGYPTDLAEELVRERNVTRVYTCGPEVMMRKAYDISDRAGIEYEASLERSMKCGIGICGSCTVGRNLLCRDGAVLDAKALKASLEEFGLLQRDASGRYIKV